MGGQGNFTQDDIDAKVEYLFSHSFNHTLHAYIDITGDLIAGTLLSQIMYWFSEGANRTIRASIYKDGHYWIAKRREDWMDEIRISKKQYDCAIKKLTVDGNELVEVKKYQFNGIPMTHIRPLTENINKAVAEWKSNLAQLISAQCGNGCNGSSPKGNMEVSQKEISNYPKGEYGSSPNSNMEVPQKDNSYNIYNNIYNTNTKTTNKEYNTETTDRDGKYILSGTPDDTSDNAPENVPKKTKKPKAEKHTEEIRQIIDYFNRVCGTNYQYQSAGTAKHINARLNEGFTVEDFYKVIDTKYAEWHNDSYMCKYLRPQTLFNSEKFENYLNQRSAPAAGGADDISQEMADLYNAIIIK